ncbi:MAG: hypothetical protein EAZ51_07485 [Sphingobacteriales bacterium]|nr:MAG: hypothetical protein EAZ64_03635 [Sphingobacteriales bacterium]TAF79658.1 MAG: hypothetical protein EAZ51_07485 [Sphingobacteriales bacterium]
MKIKIFTFLSLIALSCYCYAQDFSLNNTGTLYDSFENPVQATSTKDVSRKYAFNFFIPSISNHVYFDGEANRSFKTMLFKQKIDSRDINTLGQVNMNYLQSNSNNYLLMFKIYSSVKYKRELGIALQLRHESNFNISNETFAIIDNYGLFANNNFSNIFNGNGYSQSYSQLGFTYRQNYDKNWAWGAKLSVLNGILYAQGDLRESSLTIDRVENVLSQTLVGSAKSSFGTGVPTSSVLYPTFKNPGLSVNLGLSYTSPDGIYFSGHVKDLGFIKWGKNSTTFDFNEEVSVFKANANDLGVRYYDKFSLMLANNAKSESFYTRTNAKIEVLASKTFGFYKPNIIISKNVFQQDGAIAAINNFNYGVCNVSVNGFYNTRQGFNVGSQFMVKAPNVEFYVGSESVLPSLRFANGYLSANPGIGANPTRADFYMGFSLKFGKLMQHFSNADEIPGITDGDQGKGVKNLNAKGWFGFLKKKEKTKNEVDKRRDKKP